MLRNNKDFRGLSRKQFKKWQLDTQKKRRKFLRKLDSQKLLSGQSELMMLLAGLIYRPLDLWKCIERYKSLGEEAITKESFCQHFSPDITESLFDPMTRPLSPKKLAEEVYPFLHYLTLFATTSSKQINVDVNK
jgi:hypothetical protein